GSVTNPARRKPAERSDAEGGEGGSRAGGATSGGSGFRRATGARSGSGSTGPGKSSAGKSSTGKSTVSRAGTGSAGRTSSGTATAGRSGDTKAGSAGGGISARRAPPKVRKALPELKRVQLDAPTPDTVFVDRDGERVTFTDSNLKRVAARILSERNKAWRYRPFGFPLFTDKGHEQTFHFDFYVYDYEDSVIRLILVIPFESREVWDRVGRFKRQYPMYTYELWTPEKLAFLDGPRGRLEF
ncbi:hypothetical protein, partial [Deinococcus sp.]|uniref:hypothetical protein n=1 Tax=Deinococcus sp. TaxID=47478 RepID=UPI002869CD9A